MKKWADKDRRPAHFDLVLVKLQPNQLRVYCKVHKGLIRKSDWTFPIVGRVGQAAYRVQLPARLKLHPVFHASCLKPYHGDSSDERSHISSRAPPP